MWIERSNYIPAAEALSQILDRYQEGPVRDLYQDFLSEGLFDWCKRAVASVAFQVVWKNDPKHKQEQSQIHDQLVSELVQTLLVNPLNQQAYVQPMRCGDWTLERAQWEKLKLLFAQSTSPLDGCPMSACQPTAHLFAQEMVAWKTQWVRMHAPAVCIHLPTTQKVEKQALALNETVQPSPLERFKWIQLCTAAASRKRLQQVRQLAQSVVLHCHNRQIVQTHTLKAELATALAYREAEKLRTQVARSRETCTGKAAVLTEALSGQTLVHQQESRTWLMQKEALHANAGQEITSLHQAVRGTQEALDEESSAKKAQVAEICASQAAEAQALQEQNIQAQQELISAMAERSEARKKAWETQKAALNNEGQIQHLEKMAEILEGTHAHQRAHIETLKKG